MNAFWSLIDTMPKSMDYEERADALSAALDGLTVEEYKIFLTEFSRQVDDLTTNPDLANAIYLYNEDNLSGDTMHDFCYWLISLGHDNLKAVIASPDKIMDFTKIFCEPNFEELGSAVWKRANLEDISLDSAVQRLPADWRYEDSKQQERFPRLYRSCHGS